MNQLQRPSIPFDDHNSPWQSNIVKIVNANSMGSGINANSYSSPNGINISLPSDKLPNKMAYVGIYKEDGQYNINDCVYVDPLLSYSFNTASNYQAGMYVALQNVPLKSQNSSYFINNVVPIYISASALLNDNVANAYQWSFNTYYPCVYSGSATITQSNGYNVIKNQQYWQQLSSPSTGGGISFQGEWNPNNTYRTGSLVVVSPDSNAALLGYPEYALILGLSGSVNASGSFTGSFNSGLTCTQSSMPGYYLSTLSVSPINMSGSYSGSNSSSFSFHCPQIPYTSYWMMIEPYPVQEYKMEGFGLKDYFTASIVTSSGNISNPVIPLIPVAKCTQTRMISFESSSVTGYNFNYWYAYPTGSISASVYIDGYVFDHGVWESSSLHACSCENIRYCYTGSLSGSLAETQSCYPRYLSGNIIDGYIPYNGTGVWWTSSNGCIFPVYIQEMTDRRWVKRYNSK